MVTNTSPLTNILYSERETETFRTYCKKNGFLTEGETEKILTSGYQYINLIQRLTTPDLEAEIFRTDETFIVKSTGFLIPYLDQSVRSEESIRKLLSFHEIENEDADSELMFAGIPDDQAQIIMAHPDFETVWQEPCYLYVYEDKPYEVDETKLFQNLRVDVLRSSDVDKVFKYYTFPDDGPEYISEVIENELTFCLRDGDDPVSWLVRREDGSMGIMYTMENYRRMGLGHYLTQFLVNAIIKRGETPYLHIHVPNTASIKLAESLGFKRVERVNWFGIRRK